MPSLTALEVIKLQASRKEWERERESEREGEWSCEEEKEERQMEAGEREKERLTIVRRQVAKSPLPADEVNFLWFVCVLPVVSGVIYISLMYEIYVSMCFTVRRLQLFSPCQLWYRDWVKISFGGHCYVHWMTLNQCTTYSKTSVFFSSPLHFIKSPKFCEMLLNSFSYVLAKKPKTSHINIRSDLEVPLPHSLLWIWLDYNMHKHVNMGRNYSF